MRGLTLVALLLLAAVTAYPQVYDPTYITKDDTGHWIYAAGPNLPNRPGSIPDGSRFYRYGDGWHRYQPTTGWVREVDSNGRLLHNVAPAYDYAAGALSAGMWLDPGTCAGGTHPPCEYGSTFNLPVGGTQHNLIRLTGTLGSNTLSSVGEFAGIRFELQNEGPDLNSAVRGIIGTVSITAGGHARPAYFRATAETGSTGYFTSGLFAASAAATQTLGNAVAVAAQSDGAPNLAYAFEASNNPGTGWNTGLFMGDAFEASAQAIRLRQGTTNSRIRWGSAGPMIESASGDLLGVVAGTATATRFGVGTLAPQRALHVLGVNGAVAAFPTTSTSDGFVLENNSGPTGMAFVIGATAAASLKWYGSGDATFDGRIAYSRNTRALTFSTSATDRLTLDTSGNLIQSPGAYIEGSEIAVPANPAANGYRLFAEDNGSGKTRLCAIFSSGVKQCFATEP